MTNNSTPPKIPLPQQWKQHVRSAVLHVISLAAFVRQGTRGQATGDDDRSVREAAKIERLEAEVAMLREEIRIKDARMQQIAAQNRPHYQPQERLAILELRAARNWNLSQTADAFLVTPATITAWGKRVDELGEEAIVQLPEPVNKFPDFVRYSVQRLRTLCPSLGKVKIAEILSRAGLHIGVTTVGRIVKEPPHTAPSAPATEAAKPVEPTAEVKPTKPSKPKKQRAVTAKYVNHVWHVDLTTVPIAAGYWASWFPFALPLLWPFVWWVVAVMDHKSRRVLGYAVFKRQPTAVQVRQFLGTVMHQQTAKPKYLISDQGVQFTAAGYEPWCQKHNIKPRFGAIGQHGSIAIIERFILSLKTECISRILVPFTSRSLRTEIDLYLDWYNDSRPHMSLDGRTPNEVYFERDAANQKPRIEPRSRWPRGSPCAKPQVLVQGKCGQRFELVVDFQSGRKHLPLVSLKKVA